MSQPGDDQKQTRVLYNTSPDYTKPLLEIPREDREDLFNHLVMLYGRDEAFRWLPELERIIRVHHAHKPPEKVRQDAEVDLGDLFSERDMVVITYGDMLRGEAGMPLHVLLKVCQEATMMPNIVHILPFFPYSSDRGFAVVDFEQVDPKLGDWQDIRALAGNYKLMFDGVLNHVSSQSRIFQEFLDGLPLVQNFFIAYDSPDELTPDQRSKIFRPRTSDILTRFETYNGTRYLWTTFSEDQIDLNYRDPEVLIFALEALLFYVRMGANLLRLDAVTYIWAEPGTECVHLAETHEIVKLIRSVMDLAAPGTAVITETNVPHADNVSYFGNGRDEAHLVYNFALPPLVLYTIFTGDAGPLTRWAADLEPPSDQTHFFNILDTHDGVGVMGVRGILSPEQIQVIIDEALDHGALVSMKTVEGGGQEPYEINSTWWSVLNKADSGETMELQVRRYTASRSIVLVLKGVPGIYMHGALGSDNDYETFERTKHARDLNRGYVDVLELDRQMEDPGSKFSLLMASLRPLQKLRVEKRAFHPRGAQKVLDLDPRVFAVLRTSPGGDERILALTNMSGQSLDLAVPVEEVGGATVWRDLVADSAEIEAQDGLLRLSLSHYQVLWMEPSA